MGRIVTLLPPANDLGGHRLLCLWRELIFGPVPDKALAALQVHYGSDEVTP